MRVQEIPKSTIRNSFLLTLLQGLFFGILAIIRTRGKLQNPGIWVEDSYYLTEFQEQGWASLFNSSNDFLNFGTRFLSALIQHFTIVHYPIASISVAITVTISTCMLISRMFGGTKGFLCACLVILFPADPEVLGLPSYLFWILGVYLLALIISDYQLWSQKAFNGHCALAVFAGLSGPIVLMTVPIMLARYVLEKRRLIEVRRTLRLFFLLSFTSVIQAIYRLSTNTPASEGNSKIREIALWPIRTVGSYLVGIRWADLNLLIGIVVTALLILLILRSRLFDFTTFALAALFIMATAQSALRVDIIAIHPTIAGTRYFFIPHVLLGWLFVHILSNTTRLLRLPLSFLLVAVVAFDSYSAINRPTDPIHWGSYISTCKTIPNLSAPIFFDGSRHNTWTLVLTPEMCRNRLLDPLFERSEKELAFDYRNANRRDFRDLACTSSVNFQDNFNGTDYWNSDLRGVSILGSSGIADPISSHTLELRLKRGDSVLFSWGTGVGQKITISDPVQEDLLLHLPPTQDWKMLTFNHPELPDEFEITVTDSSNEWGSWSAVGLKEMC